MRALPLFAILAVASPDLCSQATSDAAWQETLRMSQMKRHVKKSMESQPDYTCLATFDRFRREAKWPAERKFDTVRVEVAYVGGKELYSWPGEGKFSDAPLSRMVGVGMTGDGAFATHAHNVFVFDNGIETYVGEEQEPSRFGSSSRKLLRWDFKISPYLSGWTIQQENTSQQVGSAGSFWVDAQTLDLVRMKTHATDFLEGFPVKSVEDTVEYERIHIGDQDVLLPVRSELIMVKPDGSGGRNLTEYTNCRQYSGQSTISFGAPPEPATPAPALAKANRVDSRLPPNLSMQIRLSGDLVLARATVGDLIEGTLTAPIRDSHQELAPKGATVRGRIRLLTTRPRGDKPNEMIPEFAELGLVFDELEFPGHLARFTAILMSFDSLVPNVRLTALADQIVTENTMTRTVIVPTQMPGTSVFFIQSRSTGLPKGTLMTWRTE